MPGFYDVNALQKIAINLFYGWGYNFYRAENQLRADDQFVRRKAEELLARACECVVRAESEFRRVHFPTPTRANPYPSSEAVTGAQSLERLAASINALKARVNSQPVPEADRMTQRYREEGATLARLIACDEQLVGQSELLRSSLDEKDDAWILENLGLLREGVKAMAETLEQRADLISGSIV